VFQRKEEEREMGKRLAYHFMVLVLMLSFSLFLNACAKNGAMGERVIEQKEEVIKAEDKTLSEEERLRLKAEQEKTEREARLKEEALYREAFENEDIHFDFDRAFLADEARRILARKTSWLLDHPDVRIEIEGHCDERGTNEYNMALGERRANSAMEYLIAAGVKAGSISTISYGEEKPVDSGHDEKAWAKNRRAHFRIVSD
jgi:peptidoglycan-associated lipoprotein